MIDLKEVNRQIDWLVNNMPFAPPPWATRALAELIEKKKLLEESAQSASDVDTSKEFYGYVVWPRMGGTPWFQREEPQGYVEFNKVYKDKE